MLVNLNLLGISERDLSKLPEYCAVISRVCNVSMPYNYPIVGDDSFRTATGVHAAAIVKALGMKDAWLADRVYCGVPASMVGREQRIEIGPMSGEHNVRFWLSARGIEINPLFVEKILAAAKHGNKLLSEDQILRIVKVQRARLARGEGVTDKDLGLEGKETTK